MDASASVVTPGHAPFSEELLEYPVEDYPFYEHVQALYGVEELPLEMLHNGSQNSGPTRERKLGKARDGLIQHAGFRDVYHRFIRNFVRDHLQEDVVLFEHNPDLRIHPAGTRSITAPHTDAQSKHSPCEVNFWVPLTSTFGTNTLWTELEPGLADFHPLEANHGQVVRFYGNACLHYTVDNETDVSRVSFDLRVVRLRDFAYSGIYAAGEGSGPLDRWLLFSYYDVMGPNGLVQPGGEWEDMVRCAKQLGRLPLAAPSLPAEVDGQVVARRERPRSPSAEHVQRCSQIFGCERSARRRCGRCGWIALRSKLQRQLVYRTSSGAEVPWIAESDDLLRPWGLGCIRCANAYHKSRGSNIQRSAFTEFTYGVGTHGLLIKPLLKHGNHSKLQRVVGEQQCSLLEFNEGHAFACSFFDKCATGDTVPMENKARCVADDVA